MKIFSKDKYLKSKAYLDNKEKFEKCSLPEGVEEWYIQCDGKTKEECNDLGFLIAEKWLIEEETNNE